MSESLLSSRPASALRHSSTLPPQPQQQPVAVAGDQFQQGGISLLSGVASAAYAASFASSSSSSSQQNDPLPPIMQPRAELRPTLSPYVPDRQPAEYPIEPQQPAHYPQQQQQQQQQHMHHTLSRSSSQGHHHPPHPHPVYTGELPHFQHALRPQPPDWWSSAPAPAWSGRPPWTAHTEAAQFMQARGCPPIVVDSRPPSEASSDESLGSMPEEPEHHVPLRGATFPALPFRPPYPISAPVHHHHPYLNWVGQAPSPASSCHSLAPYGQQGESPVWASGFQNFSLSDHSRPSSANAEGLSPGHSPVTTLSRTHSMDSAQDLLAAASAEEFSQSDPEGGPVRRIRTRTRTSLGSTVDDDPPADLTSKTTKATQQAAIARRKPGSEARFECPYCHSTFTRSYNLKGHIRAHKGERPFACTFDGCAKAFARHHDLKRHMELHAPGNRRSHCASCSKSFKRPEALLRHYQMEPEHRDAATASSDDVSGSLPRPSPTSASYSSGTKATRKSTRAAKASVSEDAEGEDDEYLE